MFGSFFNHSDIIPFHEELEREKGKGFTYRGKEFVHHSHLSHHQTAFHRLNLVQISVLSSIAAFLFVGLLFNWHATITIFVAVLTAVYFLDLLFNFFLIYRSFSKSPEIMVSEEEIRERDTKDWPTYTIFCPLYHEPDVVPQFVTAISNLEYPKDKLQVLLLLEEDDTETIEKTKLFVLPSYFHTLIVPHSLPKTKPKALNYGLLHATGEYAVIYDAEDIPDPTQLKQAVMAFGKAHKQTICIQAKLNFYNPHQNILTRLFTAEYSLWFDLVLTGLQSIHAPIPLGGTSNHFRTRDLHSLKGWDAFNVTEDCDLGMRLLKLGYRTAVINSVTMEEANSHLGNWFNQRTRWIKGYIQTYFVHMRSPHHFFKNWKYFHLLTFQLVVGGKIMSMIINPIMWIVTISYFAFRPIVGTFIESFYPTPVLYMAVISLVFGNFLYMYYYMIGCAKREHDDIMKYAFLVPIYWLLLSMAAWTAVFRFLHKPHYWSKTKHGLHLKTKYAVKQAAAIIEENVITPAQTPIPDIEGFQLERLTFADLPLLVVDDFRKKEQLSG